MDAKTLKAIKKKDVEQTAIERRFFLNKRYFKSTTSHPEGILYHSFRCSIRNSKKICDCGFIHDLRMLREDAKDAEDISHSDFYEEMLHHDKMVGNGQ